MAWLIPQSLFTYWWKFWLLQTHFDYFLVSSISQTDLFYLYFSIGKISQKVRLGEILTNYVNNKIGKHDTGRYIYFQISGQLKNGNIWTN